MGVLLQMSVSMFVLNCLQISGERELMCVLMWVPWVAPIIVLSSHFYCGAAERVQEDLGYNA